MSLLITKQDIADVTGNFTVNIEDRLINPKIKDAQVFDLGILLGAALAVDVEALPVIPGEYDPEIEYLTGTDIVYNSAVYSALADVTGVVPTDTTNWKLNALATLRHFHLKEFLAWHSYRRFLLTHGRNVTQAGLTIPSDPLGTYQIMSDKGRAELMADAESKANYYANKITGYLRTNNLTTTSEGCGYTRSTSSRFRISGI